MEEERKKSHSYGNTVLCLAEVCRLWKIIEIRRKLRNAGERVEDDERGLWEILSLEGVLVFETEEYSPIRETFSLYAGHI